MREGYWFYKRLVLARQWDIYLKSKFESLGTFLPSLFCLGLETKGAKFPPRNKYRDFVVLAIPLLKSYPFQTASQIFLTSMATLLSFHGCKLMPFRKNGLSADGTEPLHWQSDFFRFFYFSVRLFHVLCMTFLSATLQNYIWAGCWPILSKLEYRKTFVR